MNLLSRPDNVREVSASIFHEERGRLRTGYLVHQCNCVTGGRVAGLAREVVQRFKVAPVAGSVPGSHRIVVPTVATTLYIAELYAQYLPGRPGLIHDTAPIRLGWFARSLDAVMTEAENDPAPYLHIPFNIGCGLAQGNPHDYEQALYRVALLHPTVTVTRYNFVA